MSEIIEKEKSTCKECDRQFVYFRKSGGAKNKCNSCYTKKRRLMLKEKILEYLGDSCNHCGYNRCKGALDVHHVNKEEKDFTISGKYCHSWKKLKAELEKCVLLCANCHREHHHNCLDYSCKHFEKPEIIKQIYSIPNETQIGNYSVDGRSLLPMYRRKYGSNKDYINSWNKQIIDQNKYKVKLILQSNIDFTKWGWKKELAKLIDIKHQKVKQWLRKHMPELYEKYYGNHLVNTDKE